MEFPFQKLDIRNSEFVIVNETFAQIAYDFGTRGLTALKSHWNTCRIMSMDTSQIIDKTIVERLRPHANDASRKAVREQRAVFNGKGEKNDLFILEVLELHAKSQEKGLYPAFFLVLIAVYFAHFAIPSLVLLPWTFVAILLLAWINRTARTFNESDKKDREVKKWQTSFQIIQLAVGLMWAILFGVHPLFSTEGGISVLTFAGSMVLIGLSLVTTRYLKYGVLCTCVPFTAVVAGRLTMEATFPSIGMAFVLIGACFFFARIADLMRSSQFDFLTSRAERDQLIMELESARGVSEEARRRAEEANLAKSRFLATMSHELRTPLNAILGFSEIMNNEVMGPLNNDYYKEYAGDIHSSGTHLLKLINEILDLSRVEAGRYELHESATSLAYAAEECQQMVKLKASEKDVEIVMQIQPDMPDIWADARAVRQIMLNLLSNALKFTPPSGTVWLKVGWTAGGGQYVCVKDTGPGIPEEEIPIVLSSFGQGSIAIKSAEQGTGLGLPIVQALVQMHDGEFTFQSKLREGTQVTAAFPRKRVMEELPAVPQDATSKPAKRSLFTARHKDSTAA